MNYCKTECEFSGNDEELFCNECHENVIECTCGNETLEGIKAGYHWYCVQCGLKNREIEIDD